MPNEMQHVISDAFNREFPMWYVAHTRPRREKKLATECQRFGIDVTLPVIESVKRYPRKVVKFKKPLFPGYVFFRCALDRVRWVHQNNHVANVLYVTDQATFQRQVDDILHALSSGAIVSTLRGIFVGRQVRITAGPMRGLSGRVVRLCKKATIVLDLDFIGQSVQVSVEEEDLEAEGP